MSMTQDGQSVPTLEELTAACGPIRELTERRDAAKRDRNAAVVAVRVQGAPKKALEAATGMSQRAVAYAIEGVKTAPTLGVSPDLPRVEAAAQALESAEQRLAQGLEERDQLIRRARRSKQYTIQQLQEATGLARSTLYKV